MNRIKDFFGASRTRMTLGALGLLVVGAILGGVVATAIPALAASHNNDATNNTLVANAGTTGSGVNGYCTLYEQTLANNLGVSVSKLESANVSAIDTVIDQLVKDGKLTSDKAASLKQMVAANGSNVCSHVAQFINMYHGRHGAFGQYGAELKQIRQDVQAAVAAKLGYANAAALRSALTSTDIVSLAKSKGVSQATLNATIRATVKSDLDKLVSNKTITSAQEAQALALVDQALSAGKYGLFGLGHGNEHPQFGAPGV